MLRDVNELAESIAMEQRPPNEKNTVDLRRQMDLEPILVTNDAYSGPLIAIDGNHRLTAHYLRHQSVDAVNVFVAVHQNILMWGFVPLMARNW